MPYRGLSRGCTTHAFEAAVGDCADCGSLVCVDCERFVGVVRRCCDCACFAADRREEKRRVAAGALSVFVQF
jgi:hypothetical protein